MRPKLRTCKYRGCDNLFPVNGAQKFCSRVCKGKEALAIIEDRQRMRIVTAPWRHEYYLENPLPGSLRYDKRVI